MKSTVAAIRIALAVSASPSVAQQFDSKAFFEELNARGVMSAGRVGSSPARTDMAPQRLGPVL